MLNSYGFGRQSFEQQRRVEVAAEKERIKLQQTLETYSARLANIPTKTELEIEERSLEKQIEGLTKVRNDHHLHLARAKLSCLLKEMIQREKTRAAEERIKGRSDHRFGVGGIVVGIAGIVIGLIIARWPESFAVSHGKSSLSTSGVAPTSEPTSSSKTNPTAVP